MILNQIQHEVLIGILLGDANLQTFNKGRTYRLRILQKNLLYVEHLYSIFSNFVKTSPKVSKTKKNEVRYYFNTITHPVFRNYALLFYGLNNNKLIKKIPMDFFY